MFSSAPPSLPELALVTMALVTNEGQTCCASQLQKVIDELNLRSFHSRSIYTPMIQLCQEGFIKLARVDSEREAMLRKKGRRKHYTLTRTGREEAESLYLARKDYYDQRVPLMYVTMTCCWH